MSVQLNNASVAAAIIDGAKTIFKNDSAEALVNAATKRGEVRKSEHGAVVADTGKFTGRSASDKFIVKDATTSDSVWWDNTNSLDTAQFDVLMADMLKFAEGQELFQQQLFGGADASCRYSVDVFTPHAWHALFIQHLLIQPELADLAGFDANTTILHMPGFQADPTKHGSKTTTCIALDFTRNIVLICGTFYAGEIKKSVFSLFNYHAPADDIFPMHCSANLSKDGDTTLFFGLSGTGKTTLSTEPSRALIGDDEHGWSATGVFNLEGGCYAKAINLSAEGEPEIWQAARQPGAVIENVTMNDKGVLDYTDASKTENTRIAYPLSFIENRVDSGIGPTPKNVVLMSADAFGVLPPIARLTIEQAIYYFLSGYTAKVAGTERGVTEPQATFSACFGAPFMSRHPSEYGKLLAKRLGESNANCWLLNTGWTGGAYGTGHRMPLKSTRRLLDAALAGELDSGEFRIDPVFGFDVPTSVQGVEDKILNPIKTWADADAFTKQAKHLVDLFEQNFAKLGPTASALTSAGLSASRAA